MENKAYNLGRLFAQMEAEGVVRPEEYQTAGITPTPVIVPAFARLAERGRMDTITEVMNQLPMDAFTSTPFTANEQTAFALGYYHQKARMLDGQEETDTPLDTRMLIRVESDLKQWVMAQGGSDYVRRLLRRERARGEQ